VGGSLHHSIAMERIWPKSHQRVYWNYTVRAYHHGQHSISKEYELIYVLFLPKSTIMLAVNVSFLAVPNMFIPQSQSVGVIAIYVSTIFITGSLIASIQLTRGAKIYNSESAQDAVSFAP